MEGDEKAMILGDDISFCPFKGCRRKTCPRNQRNIRDRTIPHSFFVERPPDCPYRKKQDNFYHVREKTVDKTITQGNVNEG